MKRRPAVFGRHRALSLPVLELRSAKNVSQLLLGVFQNWLLLSRQICSRSTDVEVQRRFYTREDRRLRGKTYPDKRY
jgi:hypothetical protein